MFFKMCHVIRRLLLFHQSPFDEFLHAIKEIGGTHAKQQNHARWVNFFFQERMSRLLSSDYNEIIAISEMYLNIFMLVLCLVLTLGPLIIDNALRKTLKLKNDFENVIGTNV